MSDALVAIAEAKEYRRNRQAPTLQQLSKRIERLEAELANQQASINALRHRIEILEKIEELAAGDGK